jgi:hypothetical protein
MLLNFVPGKPGGPGHPVYYSEAKHEDGRLFTISKVTVGGEDRYCLWVDKEHVASFKKADDGKVRAVRAANDIARGEPISNYKGTLQ